MKKTLLTLFILGLVTSPALLPQLVRADLPCTDNVPEDPQGCFYDPSLPSGPQGGTYSSTHPGTSAGTNLGTTSTTAAGNASTNNTNSNSNSSTNNSATKGTCKFDQQSTQLCNPIPENNLNAIIVKGLKIVLGLIGSVAVVVIVLAGFKMVYSQGNAEAIKGAKSSITWAVVGLVVALLAYTIVAIVTSTLTTAK